MDDILGCKGEEFRTQMIDGEALLMVSKQDLREGLGLKLGPAITFSNCIQILREKALECSTD